MVLYPFSYQLWLYNKIAPLKMFRRVPEENTEHCFDCSLPHFWFLLCDRCVVLFREIYTPAWLLHFGPSWCTIEDKWKWWRVRDSRQSWLSDSVAEGQGLMHPFLLSKWFLSLCFFVRSREKMRGPDKGCLEDGHICANEKDVAKEQNWVQ